MDRVSDRTKAERSLDEQNELLRHLGEAEDIMRRQHRAVSSSARALRRLMAAEQARLAMIRRDLHRLREKA